MFLHKTSMFERQVATLSLFVLLKMQRLKKVLNFFLNSDLPLTFERFFFQLSSGRSVMQRLLYWKLFIPETVSYHWFWSGFETRIPGFYNITYRLLLGGGQALQVRVSNMRIVMDEQTGRVVSAEDHDTDCAKVPLPLTLLRYAVLNVQTVSWL